MSILAPRSYQSGEEQRLASALDASAEQMLKVVDAACRLRTAPGDAKRHRQNMRTFLEQATNSGMDALAHAISARQDGP